MMGSGVFCKRMNQLLIDWVREQHMLHSQIPDLEFVFV